MKTKPAAKLIFSVMLSVTAVVCGLFNACPVDAANDGKCKVNDLEFSVGDIITYTLNIDKAAEKFSGIDISVYYDPECLSLETDKVSLPVFKNALFNTELDGEIRFNAIDVVDGFDFINGGTVISAAFKICENAKDTTNITFSIRELYGMDVDDTENITDYKTSVNIVKETLNDEDIVKPKDLDVIENELATQYGVQDDENNGSFAVWAIVGGVVILAAAAIITTVVIKKRKNRENFDGNMTKN